MSWAQWHAESEKYAAALIALGLKAGDRVAILCSNGPEWVIADQAILSTGCVTVPIYASNLAQHCASILEDSGARVAIVEDPLQLEKLCQGAPGLEQLEHIIVQKALTVLDRPDSHGRTRIALEDVLHAGRAPAAVIRGEELGELAQQCADDDPNAVRTRRRAVRGPDAASIVYTSGTSGRPRGVVLTHSNFAAEVAGNAIAIPIDESDEQLLILPLSHAFARVLYMTAVRAGTITTFSAGFGSLLEELAQIRPTFIVGVPAVFDRLQANLLLSAQNDAILRRLGSRRLVAGAVDESKRRQAGESRSPAQHGRYFMLDRLLFRRVRALFGGKLRFAISGGAPLASEVADFFVGAGVPLLEGYGLTETCGAALVNRPDHFRTGTVGTTLRGVEAALAEDGEILLRGSTISPGYWNSDEKIVDDKGWFRTGDIGEFDDEFLRVTDRKKDLIVTALGRSVSPQFLETQLKTIPLVERACVHGDDREFVSALITLDREALRRVAESEKLGTLDPRELAQHKRIYELVGKGVARVNAELPAAEQVRRFAILAGEFRLQTGELTPTMKLRRRFVTEKYRSIFDSFYSDADAGRARAE